MAFNPLQTSVNLAAKTAAKGVSTAGMPETPMQKAARIQAEKDQLSKERIGSMGEQVSKLEAAPEAIAAQGAAQIGNIRRDQGAILARGRGLLGGGGGLAMMRGAAQERQGQEAESRAAFENQRQAAIQLAAKAKTEFIGEQEKVLADQQARANNAQTALSRAAEILLAEEDKEYTTWDPEDRERAADAIMAEFANETDPIVLQAVQKYAQQVRSGEIGGAGLVNT